MNLQDLRTLLDYHYWARDRLLAAVDVLTPEQYAQDLGSSFPSIRATLAHLYAAEWAWHERWQGQSPTAPLAADMFPDVAAIRRAWSDLEVKVRAFLEKMGDEGLDRVFQYTFVNGQSGQSVFRHMLQHVVNHASYHRGQVTTMLRQLGAKPGQSMDIIRFYREHSS